MVAGPALADPVSLGQAVSLGLTRSPELGQAQARVGAAEAGRDQAQREWLPQVELNGAFGWRHLENDARVQLGLSSLDERPLYATIGVQQPIWDFGRRSNAIGMQKGRLTAASWDERATGEAAAFAIARVYLQVMVQQSIVEAAQANLDFHADLAADVGEGVEKGAMSISERQQAEERLENARLTLNQAKADLATAKSELALLVGVAGFELVAPPDPSGVIPASLDEALAVTETNDPRLHSAEAKFNSAERNASRARSEYLPTFGLQGTIRMGKDFEGYRGTTRDYELLVVARWNVFDGGITAAKVREADHGTDEARFSLAQVQRESELAVRKSWIAMDNWHLRMETQQQRLEVSRSVLDSYSAQFGIGRRSLLDLLDAQNAVFNATVDTSVASAGLLLSQYGLLGQMGRLRSFFGVGRNRVDPALYGPQ